MGVFFFICKRFLKLVTNLNSHFFEVGSEIQAKFFTTPNKDFYSTKFCGKLVQQRGK